MFLLPLSTSLKRALILCLLLLGCLHSGFAQSLPGPFVLKVISSTALVTSTHYTPQELQTNTGVVWKDFDPTLAYPTGDGTALWIKLHFAVGAPVTGWTVKVAKPHINRIELHTLSQTGAWVAQAAGDKVMHSQWPMRGLHPQFRLPALNVGEHIAFLKVHSLVPIKFSFQISNEEDSYSDNFDHLLRSCLSVMFGLCMAFITAYLSWVYRDKAYAVYSFYAVLASVTVAAYTGLGNYLLWPHSIDWPDKSIHVSLLLSLIVQMVFCFMCFQPHLIWRKFVSIAWATGSATVASVAVLLFTPQITLYTAVFLAALLLNCAVIVNMVWVRLRQGELSAKLWVLAYVPLSLLVIITALDEFGLISISWLGYYLPVYAFIFEILVLPLALMLRAQRRDVHRTAMQVRQQLDPLTGFILSAAYVAKAKPMWEQACIAGNNLAVVYIQITQPDAPAVFVITRRQQASSERVMRVIRTVFRQDDIYAQVSHNVYAVLMPGKLHPDTLKNSLTRLVAQIHMLSRELEIPYPLRARIVACSSNSVPIPWQKMHQAMLDKLHAAKGWDQRHIRYLRKRKNNLSDEDSDLSDFWAYALDASTAGGNSDTSPPISPSPQT